MDPKNNPNAFNIYVRYLIEHDSLIKQLREMADMRLKLMANCTYTVFENAAMVLSDSALTRIQMEISTRIEALTKQARYDFRNNMNKVRRTFFIIERYGYL